MRQLAGGQSGGWLEDGRCVYWRVKQDSVRTQVACVLPVEEHQCAYFKGGLIAGDVLPRSAHRLQPELHPLFGLLGLLLLFHIYKHLGGWQQRDICMGFEKRNVLRTNLAALLEPTSTWAVGGSRMSAWGETRGGGFKATRRAGCLLEPASTWGRRWQRDVCSGGNTSRVGFRTMKCAGCSAGPTSLGRRRQRGVCSGQEEGGLWKRHSGGTPCQHPPLRNSLATT